MSQMELRSVPALKKEIIRLALAAAVQLLFALWFYAFCCGLLSLGSLRLPYGVKVGGDGYEMLLSHSQLATKVMSSVTGVSKSNSTPSSFQHSKDTLALVGSLGSVALPPSRTVCAMTSVPPSLSKVTV